MNDPRRAMAIERVDHYDGQAVYVDQELAYELGGYLGGGAAGVCVSWSCWITGERRRANVCARAALTASTRPSRRGPSRCGPRQAVLPGICVFLLMD